MRKGAHTDGGEREAALGVVAAAAAPKKRHEVDLHDGADVPPAFGRRDPVQAEGGSGG